jgi:hypothetical protein
MRKDDFRKSQTATDIPAKPPARPVAMEISA